MNTREKVLDGLLREPITECWEWTGSRTKAGYGKVSWKGRLVYVHRLVYELLEGPIPEGLQIDHICRNRACANPDHLRLVEFGVNQAQGGAAGLGKRRKRRTLD